MIAHWKVGVIERDRGNLRQAVEAFEKAIELDPDNPDFYHNLGTAQRLLGNPDAALKSYTTARALKSEDPLLYLNMGSIYQQKDQVEKAFEAYSFFLARSKDLGLNAQIIQEVEKLRKDLPQH